MKKIDEKSKYTNKGKGSPFSMNSGVEQIAECTDIGRDEYPDTERDVYDAQEGSVREARSQRGKINQRY